VKRGQISLEALIAFLVMLSIVSVSLSVLLAEGEKARAAGKALNEKTGAEKCALLVDVVYSNAGGKINKIGEACIAVENHVLRNKGKKAETIAEKINNQKTGLEVEINEHYK